MSHTVQHEKPDWEAISPRLRTRWQRLAASSRGWLTPANVVTLAGAAVSLYGLFLMYEHRVLHGMWFLLAGRLADVLDGLVADQTKTKSPIGEAFDATSDKFIVFCAIAVFWVKGLVPVLPLAILLGTNIFNLVCGSITKLRHHIIHPSRLGKYAAFMQWTSIFLFVWASSGASWVKVWAYGVFALSLVPTLAAAAGYIRLLRGGR